MIRAVILDVPDGTVRESAEWRMHDRARYLWALGGGKFLVRQRNAFLVTDAVVEAAPICRRAHPGLRNGSVSRRPHIGDRTRI